MIINLTISFSETFRQVGLRTAYLATKSELAASSDENKPVDLYERLAAVESDEELLKSLWQESRMRVEETAAAYIHAVPSIIDCTERDKNTNSDCYNSCFIPRPPVDPSSPRTPAAVSLGADCPPDDTEVFRQQTCHPIGVVHGADCPPDDTEVFWQQTCLPIGVVQGADCPPDAEDVFRLVLHLPSNCHPAAAERVRNIVATFLAIDLTARWLSITMPEAGKRYRTEADLWLSALRCTLNARVRKPAPYPDF